MDDKVNKKQEGNDISKEELNMAVLAYPTRMPIIIKNDKIESFRIKCKSSGLSAEQRTEFLKNFKSIPRDKDGKSN